MSFLGIGPLEIIVVLVIALIVLGPERMLDAARMLGKFVRDAKEVARQVPRVVVEDDDVKIVSDGKATSLTGADSPPPKSDRRPESAASAAPSEDAPAPAPTNADVDGDRGDDREDDAPVAFSRQSAPESETETAESRDRADR